MKVALLVGRLSEGSGGLATSVPAMASALLTETAVEPHILGVVDPSDPGAFRKWGRFVHPHRSYGPSSFQWTASMKGTLDSLDPDVVDTQGVWMNISRVAVTRHRSRGQPYIVTPRGMMDPWALRQSYWRKRMVAWWFENRHLGCASAVRALNEDEAGTIRRYGVKTPIVIVPNGLNIPELEEDGTDEVRIPNIQFLGRLDPKKGLEPLLHAWSIVKSDPAASNWRLDVNGWGDAKYTERLIELVSQFSIASTVTIGGPLFGAEKEAALRRASGFVLPSYSEGLPMAVLEAWVCATPVLMTRACNLPEGFAVGAAVEIEPQPEHLAQGLLAFMGMQNEDRRKMGEAGRKLVRTKFDARLTARKLALLYEWAAGGGDKPPSLQFY